MKKSILFILILFLIPTVMALESPANRVYGDVQQGFSKVTGIPTEFLKFPELLYYLLIPTLAITAITLAFLVEFDLFKKTPQVNYMIALSVGLIALASSFTYNVVAVVLALMGPFGFVVFTLIFFAGVGMFAYKKYQDFQMNFGPSNTKWAQWNESRLERKIHKLNTKAQTADGLSESEKAKLVKAQADLQFAKKRREEQQAHRTVQNASQMEKSQIDRQHEQNQF